MTFKTSNNAGTLKTLNNVWKNFDHCWNYIKNLNNFFLIRGVSIKLKTFTIMVSTKQISVNRKELLSGLIVPYLLGC